MTDRFEMTPQLRGVGRDVGEIACEVAAVMASLRAKIAGEAPGASCVITQGDANDFWSWCDQVTQVGDSAQSLPAAMRQLGDDVGRVADVFEQSDEGTAHRA
jgi:hypothetical protein